MVQPSQFAMDAIQDIRLTLREQRNRHQPSVKRPSSMSYPSTDVSCLVSEIDRLRSVLKGLAVRYYELAQSTFEDPFSPAYEQVLAELATVKQVLLTSDKQVQMYREGRNKNFEG